MNILEILVCIIGILLAFIFLKFIFKKLFLIVSLLGFAGIISFIYKVPYIISIASMLIFIYSVNTIFSEIKYMAKSFIKPCRFYEYGFYEKIVNLLFSLNYIVFMSICYLSLMNTSLSMIDIAELGIAFCITWIFVWIVLNTRSMLFNYINALE